MKSWLKYTLRTAAILLTATLLTTSCLQSDFDEPLLAGDTVKVSFNVGVDNDMVTRVGEGENINSLLVAIYKENNDFVSAEIDNATVTDGKISGNLDFELLRNQNYKAVFFAYNSTGYTVNSDFQTITANYSVSNPELLDAFRGAIDFTATANTSLSTTLTRAVALFVVGAKNENFESGEVTLSLPGAPTAFSTLTGATSDTNNISLTFTPNGSKVDGNNAYTLLAMTYVLPGTIQPTITTVDGDKQVANAITFTANKRYNLLGDSLFVNFSWGGEIEITSLPAENVDSDGWIHIKTAEELAYLIKNGDNATVAAGANISSTRADEVKKYHICPGADLDMSMWKNEDKPTTAVSFKNTIIDAGKWDEDTPTVNQTCEDGCYTIKGLTLANGIFGNAIGVTVQNLNIEGATIGSNAAEGVGIIANTATGSLTLTNITVSGTVTGASKVGGLVGYIDSETGTTATLTDCSSSATVNATAKAGALVGWFNGYDESETLNFIDCSTTSESTFTTPFCSDEQACFNTNDLALSTYEQHLLGGEEYCRGTINYGYVDGDGNLTSERFFYRWDGVRKVTPLTENSSTSIYSPYDLAYLQGNEYTSTVSSMTFHNDVDMGGTDEELEWDGNTIRTTVGVDFARRFTPIRSVKNLTGNNCTIHNLRVQMTHDGSGAGLIQNISGGTVKDLTINKAYIFNDNNWSLGIPSYPKLESECKDRGEGNAYAGTLTPIASGTTTISNIHVTNGKVFGICKMGGLIGKATDSNDMNIVGCSVEGCTIQNYRANVPNYYPIVSSISSYYITCLGAWYTQGECGGLIGFIQCKNAHITDCSVINTNIDCYEQENKGVTANIVESSRFDSSNNFKTGVKRKGYAHTLIAGRHVNQFIGDIVSQNGTGGGSDYTVTITNHTVSGNKYFNINAEITDNKYNHYYESAKIYCDIVGCAYYVGVDINFLGFIQLGHVRYYAGTLNFSKDGESYSMTESSKNGDKKDWIGGDFYDYEISLFSHKGTTTFHSAPNSVIPTEGYSKTDPRSGN
ncbi:MAG: hypothetical protein J6K33_09015 [Alistipes sp.]|nr:hypothetical protein [Alistipes sp.]